MAQLPDYTNYINENKSQAIKIDYTNYRGERRIRNIIPIKIHRAVNPYHGKEPQWLMEAFDLDKKEFRSFAFSGIAGLNLSCQCPRNHAGYVDLHLDNCPEFFPGGLQRK